MSKLRFVRSSSSTAARKKFADYTIRCDHMASAEHRQTLRDSLIATRMLHYPVEPLYQSPEWITYAQACDGSIHLTVKVLAHSWSTPSLLSQLAQRLNYYAGANLYHTQY